MDFRLLGPLEVFDGAAPVPIAAGKQRALLAMLLLTRTAPSPASSIVDALWGEDVPESAQKMVQIHVSQLRKALPEPRLQTRAPGYLLEVGDDELDLARFERAVADARAGARAGRRRTGAASCSARRSRSGAARRWPSSPSRSRGTRARVSRSCASRRSRAASRPTSRSGVTATSSASSRR